MGLLRPAVVREFGLEARGLRLIPRRPASSFTPLVGGGGLTLGEDRAASCASIRRFSASNLCGAGTHPGGGVMGACGRNAAREVLRDLARRRPGDPRG